MGRRRILVTLGDPAGIGPEVVRAALQSPDLPDDFDFELIGDPSRGKPGHPDETSAREGLRALCEAGQRWAHDPDVAAVVTGPVAKGQLERVGFSHPGQTEFFAEQSGTLNYAMCLSGNHLTVGLVTIHLPLSEVVPLLTIPEIVRVGTLLADFAGRKSGKRPRIAVSGLNPHAGEGGKFGREEIDRIAPAIQLLNETDLGDFHGPGVPDAIFRDAAHGKYDAVLAMYHDQGLIPLKLLDFDNAVNVTLGLPKPRTSPDHGTAFDIAGKGIANPSSMIAAMSLAARMARNP